jgi:hypothetical protein
MRARNCDDACNQREKAEQPRLLHPSHAKESYQKGSQERMRLVHRLQAGTELICPVAALTRLSPYLRIRAQIQNADGCSSASSSVRRKSAMSLSWSRPLLRIIRGESNCENDEGTAEIHRHPRRNSVVSERIQDHRSNDEDTDQAQQAYRNFRR